jgi:hypothetical protein
MPYISPKNEYPRFPGDIQIDFPSWKPEDPLPKGWKEVVQTPYPELQANELAHEDSPVEIDGILTQSWLVRDMTAEEIAGRDAPQTAKAKLIELGLTEAEVDALVRGMVR